MQLQFPLQPDPRFPDLLLPHFEIADREIQFSAQIQYILQFGDLLQRARQLADIAFKQNNISAEPILNPVLPFPINKPKIGSTLSNNPNIKIKAVHSGIARFVLVDGSLKSAKDIRDLDNDCWYYHSHLLHWKDD